MFSEINSTSCKKYLKTWGFKKLMSFMFDIMDYGSKVHVLTMWSPNPVWARYVLSDIKNTLNLDLILSEW